VNFNEMIVDCEIFYTIIVNWLLRKVTAYNLTCVNNVMFDKSGGPLIHQRTYVEVLLKLNFICISFVFFFLFPITVVSSIYFKLK